MYCLKRVNWYGQKTIQSGMSVSTQACWSPIGLGWVSDGSPKVEPRLYKSLTPSSACPMYNPQRLPLMFTLFCVYTYIYIYIYIYFIIIHIRLGKRN